MSPYELHADSIRQIQDYLGPNCPNFVWAVGSAPIRILPGSVKRGEELQLGAFGPQADLTFIVLTAVLPANFALNETLTYLGAAFRVVSIERFAGDTLARIDCQDAAQGD